MASSAAVGRSLKAQGAAVSRVKRSLPLGAIAAGDDVGCFATGATNLGVEAYCSAATAFLCLGDLLLAATPVQWPSMRSPAGATVGHLGERATTAHP